MKLVLEVVTSKKQRQQFIDFPHELYKGDKNYVPELSIAQNEALSRKKNPFFLHSDVQLYLAKHEGNIVGRIAAVNNVKYNEYHNSNVGFFGFLDAIDHYEVFKALFDKALEWLNQFNFDQVLGPTNFSTNDSAGLLIDGFQYSPQVMMTYNFPYYEKHISQYGFSKEMDLLAYKIPTKSVSDRSVKLSAMLEERLLKNKGVKIRNLDMKNFKSEVSKIRTIYSKAWENNWGFVPPTVEEFDHLAEGLKMVVDPKFTFVAESDNKPVAFLLALPNINEITINIKKGRLFPTGIFKLLFGKKKVRTVRVITLGVIEEYRNLGIEGILYAKIILAARNNNIDYGEASWILENNEMMNKGIEKLNGEYYKRYRIYKLPIS